METKEHNVGTHNLYVKEFIPEKESFARPVVLVHGSFGGAFMWEGVATFLADKGYHCYALSLRGHKPNDTSIIGELDMDDYKDDVRDLVEALSLERPVVIGHSMSGLVVLMYAAENPVTAVVSIGPSPSVDVHGPFDQSTIEQIPDVYTPAEAGMPTDPKEAMRALPDIPAEMLRNMKEMLGPESGKARRQRKHGISISETSITFPYLILAGEHADSVKFGVPPESSKKMAEYYNADFMQIKGATHPGILMGEHAGETAKTIARWLSEL